MSEHDLGVLFIQIAVMLAVATATGIAMRRWRLPAILGELLGGILLGPTVLGALAPGAYDALFPNIPTVTTARDALLKLGLVFFLFVAGLEVQWTILRRRSAAIAWTSVTGIAVPFALGAGAVVLWPDLWVTQARGNPAFPVLIGTALAISALPVIARILMDLHLLKEEIGIMVMASAAVNDLVGWSLFAALLGATGPDAPAHSLPLTLSLVAALLALLLGIGRPMARRVLPWLRARVPWPQGFVAVTLVVVLLVGAFTEIIGVHAFLGAFLVGVMLADGSPEQEQARETIQQFVISFFTPVYFVSIGLRTNFIANFDPMLVLIVLVVACAGKITGATLGARLGGVPSRLALAVGFGMNARGAMEMILAAVALEYKLIDARVFVALVIMALVTSLLSGPVMQRLLRAAVGPGRERTAMEPVAVGQPE